MTERGISRRDFAKSAVAIGGASALAACLDRFGAPDVPTGTDPATLPAGQHEWKAHPSVDDAGNSLLSTHHIVLLLD